MARAYATLDVQRNGADVRVELVGYVEPPTRGRTSGPPEACAEPFGGYVEVEYAIIGGEPTSLTDEENARAVDAIWEAWEKPYEW